MSFTAEELEEMRLAVFLTQEDIKRSRKLDLESRHERLDFAAQKTAAQQKADREANREKWAAYMREYRKRRAERTLV